MEIKLNGFHIQNFKGIKDLKIDADGKNLNISADNAVGKTSIIDSILWLLFDKDSKDKSDTNFTIKPQDELGQDINHLETIVEAELLLDGVPTKVKKSRVEKWVTRHGESEKTFDGHTKNYWFNEVPLKATPYKAKIDALISEDVFKMITNPLYFNTKLTWQERRSILLEVSGDMTDLEVIATDESLFILTELLNGRTIDDYKLVLADQLKDFKKQRESITPRIDELNRSLPNIEVDYKEIEMQLSETNKAILEIETSLTNAITLNNSLKSRYGELEGLKEKLRELKETINTDSNKSRIDSFNAKKEMDNNKYLIQSEIDALNNQIEQAKRTLEVNAETRDGLLATWKELSNLYETTRLEKFNDNTDDIITDCPTCKQKLTDEMLQGKVEALEKSFDLDNKKRLEALQIRIDANMAEGKALKEQTERGKLNLAKTEEKLSFKKNSLIEINKSLSILEIELSKPTEEPNYTENQEYNQLIEKIEQLQTELDTPVEDKSSELLQKKSELQIVIDECKQILNEKAEIEKKKARIEELKEDEKQLSIKIAELEGNKFLVDKFTITKVNLLEDSINNQFNHVKFKLFEENTSNENIKETCIALVNTNGSYIKFEDANDAGKINAGLDIISSLNKYYESQAPIFVDNAESVTDLAETESQVIKLTKPEIKTQEDREKYSKFIVEVEE